MQCGRDVDVRASSSMLDVAACISLAAHDALPDSADGPAVLGMSQSKQAPCHNLTPAGAAGLSPAVGWPQAEQMQTSQSAIESQEEFSQDGQRLLQQRLASRPVVLGAQDALEHVGAQQETLEGVREAVEYSQRKQECLRGLPKAAAPLEAQQIPVQSLRKAPEDFQPCRKGQGSPTHSSVAPEQSAAGFRHIKGVLTEVSQQPPAERESLAKACCEGAEFPQPGAARMPPAWQQARHSLFTAGLFVSAPAKRQRM